MRIEIVVFVMIAGCSCETEPAVSAEFIDCLNQAPSKIEDSELLQFSEAAKTVSLKKKVSVSAFTLRPPVWPKDGADVWFVLGGLGTNTKLAKAAMAAFPKDRTGFYVPSAVDDPAMLDRLFSESPKSNFHDARGLRGITVSGTTWIPIPGSPIGAYRRSDAVCGFDSSTLSQFAKNLGDLPERRGLLSWATPAGQGTLLSTVDAGDEALADFAKRLSIMRGVSAWPYPIADASTGWVGAPPSAPPATQTVDGAMSAIGSHPIEIEVPQTKNGQLDTQLTD